jgi:hypothetical protein
MECAGARDYSGEVSAPEPGPAKRTYRRPVLVVYGDVRQLTKLSGNAMGGTDRISKTVGNGMHCQERLKTGLDSGSGDEDC